MERNILKVSNESDRLTISAILIKNGYTVRILRLKQVTGKSSSIVIEYWIE